MANNNKLGPGCFQLFFRLGEGFGSSSDGQISHCLGDACAHTRILPWEQSSTDSNEEIAYKQVTERGCQWQNEDQLLVGYLTSEENQEAPTDPVSIPKAGRGEECPSRMPRTQVTSTSSYGQSPARGESCEPTFRRDGRRSSRPTGASPCPLRALRAAGRRDAARQARGRSQHSAISPAGERQEPVPAGLHSGCLVPFFGACFIGGST